MHKLPNEQQIAWDRAVQMFAAAEPVVVHPTLLAAFLEQTATIALTAAQRLRWLAVALEEATFARGWADLQAIYRAAHEAHPNDVLVQHSWGLAACHWAEKWRTPVLAERVARAEEAEQVLRAALVLAPKDGHLAYALGLVCYNHPTQNATPGPWLARATTWFRQAIAWEPSHLLAQLYLAHCYHDQHDWPQAIAAYEAVDLEQLAREWPTWRAVKCREQLAMCHAYAGNIAKAVGLFTQFLDDVATWDEATLEERIVNIDELVATVTHKLDHPELRQRTSALITRLGLAKRYPAWV